MTRWHVLVAVALACVALLAAAAVPAQSGPSSRHVDFYSEGTRLSGDLWRPGGVAPEARLPAIVMAHGWSGTRGHLNGSYAQPLAEAGFVVLAFDYRGWGDSDSKLVLVGPEPAPDSQGEITARVRAIRNVVDPFDQAEDYVHAIDFLMGEPGVDPERIGLWGTSYSGGHVVYVAAHDARVKCIVSQAGHQDSREAVARRFADEGGVEFARKRATQKARGEIGPQPPDEDRVPRLGGTPDIARLVDYRPIEFAPRIRVPTLVIDMDQEELFDRLKHGRALYEMVQSNAPAKYVLLPGKHYDVYGSQREPALAEAVAWFKLHLAP
jgi:dipeptidyl aminopeptidase/acylaminoacyl peptidase